jgi:hypothetical protein
MKKFIITESDKQNILGLYGLINEQSSGCQFENYQNGDGIKKPKITISKSSTGVETIYEGPETGFCIQHSKGSTGDSIHQLAGVTRVVVSKYLKELYANGNYVYPDLKNITMVKNNRYFKINIPFVKTTEDKAITNFNERGGWGHDGISSLNDFKNSISDKNKYGLVSVVTKVASGGNSPDITEHWVSFRDLSVYPIKTSDTSGNKNTDQDDLSKTTKSKTIIHNGDPNTLREELKKMGVVYNPQITVFTNEVKVYYRESGSRPLKLSYIFSNAGELDKVYEKVSISNSIFNEQEYNVGNFKGYIIFIE